MPAKKTKTTHQSKSSSHLPTALVAGAAGFIGSHLCDTLIHQNCKVYAIDNWSTGKKNNLKHLLKNDNFVFLEHDLNKPFKSPVPNVDYIFHLAGVEAYVNGLDISLDTLLVNSLGTRELLDIAKKQNAKFLMASTTDIFQGFLSSSDLAHYFGTDHKQQETYSHHEAKRFSEALTFEYVSEHHLDARIVRLGNVYGPRMDLRAGNDINMVSYWLGHAHLNTTHAYVEIDMETKRKMLDKTPAPKVGKKPPWHRPSVLQWLKDLTKGPELCVM